MQLSDYFKSGFLERSLERYAAEPWGEVGLPWKPVLYCHAIAAFGADEAGEEQFRHFERIYSELRSYWGTHRNGQVWDARKVFDSLTTAGRSCSMSSGISLLELSEPDALQKVANTLQGIELVKATKDESPMAISKYLHFFNPTLFPIYDNQWVRKKVLKVFKSDWNQAHAWSSSSSPRVQTYMRYLMLAHHCIKDSADNLMQVFKEWLQAHSSTSGPDLVVPAEAQQFYAAAFEMIAIGAALLETDWLQQARGPFDNYDENGVDLSLIDYMLSLTPVQRLLLMEQHAEDTKTLIEYGRRHREAQTAEGG